MQMSKIISLVKAKPGLSGEDFRNYWREHYLADILAIETVWANVERVTHNYVKLNSIREDAEMETPEWAGVGETWFSDRAAATAFLTDLEVGRVAREHSANLLEIVHVHVMEVPMWDRGGNHDAMKAIAFFHPSSAMNREQSQRYWSQEHVKKGADLDLAGKISKYVQNRTLLDFHAVDAKYDYAGAPEFWFADMGDANDLFADAAKVAELIEDEAKFSDRPTSFTLVVDEVAVYSRRS
jgi:hypothetical protein